MWIRVCHIVTQSSFPRSYRSLSLAPLDPSALSLIHVAHSTPAIPSVLLEAVFALPCVWVTNSRLKHMSKSHHQAFAVWTTSMVQETYCQPTSSNLSRVFSVSIPNTKYMICHALVSCVSTHKCCGTACSDSVQC
ncbi:unnamed protein product [Protopolystoma xenopodis]|uniref:Uncharacterized protein n=1 Tax=Protopolystoma xenopodis TaxID=117903 RepID=A0A448X0L0_9PLAT|nr:unnamed protein product [Protopolystoma xenopodis]